MAKRRVKIAWHYTDGEMTPMEGHYTKLLDIKRLSGFEPATVDPDIWQSFLIAAEQYKAALALVRETQRLVRNLPYREY